MAADTPRDLDLVTLGEALIVLTASQSGYLRHVLDFHRFIGGAELNVAVGVARLGHKSGVITRVGADEFGQAVFGFLAGEGVDTTHVQFDSTANTSMYFRERRRFDDTRCYYYRQGAAGGKLGPEQIDPAYIRRSRYLLASGLLPAHGESCARAVERAITVARDGGTTVVFDPNVRLRMWGPQEARSTLLPLIARADVFVGSEEDAQVLFGGAEESVLERIRELGPLLVVLKRGGRATLALHSGHILRVPPYSVEGIVDPVGAGDAFAAGFISGQLRGLNVEDSIRMGNAAGALAATILGAAESMPTWEDVQALMLGQGITTR